MLHKIFVSFNKLSKSINFVDIKYFNKKFDIEKIY